MMTNSNLKYSLDRTVEIQAPREIVFLYFTDSARWAKWWGAGSAIEPRPGGKVSVRYPNAVEACGEVLEIAPPERIVFTYGYASGQPIPPGASRVTIRLEAAGGATRLHLLHEFDDAAARDQHVQGWRYQLAVFANVVAEEVFRGAEAIVDAWFRAWALSDAGERDAELARIATDDVRFRDRFSLLCGLADLSAHVAASQRFLPGVRMKRQGDVRHCQGAILADWVAASADGREIMTGTNFFELGPDTRIRSAMGFASLSHAG